MNADDLAMPPSEWVRIRTEEIPARLRACAEIRSRLASELAAEEAKPLPSLRVLRDIQRRITKNEGQDLGARERAVLSEVLSEQENRETLREQENLATLRARVVRDRAELPDAIRIRADLDAETRARVDAALAREHELAAAVPLGLTFDGDDDSGGYAP